MIIFDLKCEDHGHVFEAWFGSSADYEDQRTRGLVACPICGDHRVTKALMAPAIAAKGNRQQQVAPTVPTAPVAATGDAARLRTMMETLATAQKKVLENSTWVGRDFADQARAMHYGEQDRASIHGEVAPAEARALAAEGVDVAPLPFPVIPPEIKN